MDIDKLDIDRGKINWSRIGRAVEFYVKNGYRYVETPWVVPPDIVSKTHTGQTLETTDGGVLVGSAEQGFLCLDENKLLPRDDRLVSVSPCFRPGDEGHMQHQTFMKVELYARSERRWRQYLFEDAMRFFKTECADRFLFEKRTDEGMDITINGTEIGSYGFREHDGMSWSCGTGLAEPRFSSALFWANERH